MADLTQDVDRPWRGHPGQLIDNVPLAASATVYAGAIIEIDGSGNVAKAAKGADKVYFGVAVTGGKNGTTAGETKITVRRKATVHLKKTGTAVRGKAAYVADDQTVTDVATGASKVGRIVDTDDDGVWVDMDAVGV